MLDPKKCYVILEHVIDAMRSEAEFNLLDWDIHYRCGPLDKDVDGLCEVKTPYRTAHITIDSGQCKTYEQCYETSVHEMFHVVLAPLLILDGDETTSQIWDFALEPCVVKLHRFYARKFKKFEDYFTDDGDLKNPQPEAAKTDKLEKNIWDVVLPDGYAMLTYIIEPQLGYDSHIVAIRRGSDGFIYKFCSPTEDSLVAHLKNDIKNNSFFQNTQQD